MTKRKAEEEAKCTAAEAEAKAKRKVLRDLLPPHIRTLHKHMRACTHAHKTQEEEQAQKLMPWFESVGLPRQDAMDAASILNPKP